MAGLHTLCHRAQGRAGGGLVTAEDPRHPGLLHNTHSFFHRAITRCRGTPTSSWSDAGRATSSQNSMSRWSWRRRRAGMVDRLREDRAVVRAVQPARCRTLRRWRRLPAGAAGNPCARSRTLPLPADDRRALLKPPEAADCSRPARCRRWSSCIGSSSIRPSSGRPAVLQRPAGSRPALQGFGHHIPALLASPAKPRCARRLRRWPGAGERGARNRRRDPPDTEPSESWSTTAGPSASDAGGEQISARFVASGSTRSRPFST